MRHVLRAVWRPGRLRTVVLSAVAVVACGVPLGAQESGRAARSGRFQVGDRVLLSVEGEKALTDTFTVSAGPALVLPTIGAVPLAGVKRLDVERELTAFIARFIRDPIVHARALLRVAIIGEVTRPGFYPVSVEALIPEALMSAGGPTKDARLDQVKIERNGSTLYSADSLRAAIGRGVTLAELDVRSTDAIVVPRAADPERSMRIVSVAVSVALAVFGILRLTK